MKGDPKARMDAELVGKNGAPNIRYTTKTPELEAFTMLRERVKDVADTRYDLARIEDAGIRAELTRLGSLVGRAASFMPEILHRDR